MKKICFSLLSILFCFLYFSVNCLACTGFAVYSKKTYYGMNFDYTTSDIQFSINSSKDNGSLVFSMDLFTDGKYYPCASMNNKGLFGTCQSLYPEEQLVKKDNANQMDMYELFNKIPFQTASVNDIRNLISTKNMICQNRYIHNLYADSNKDAMILESVKNQTYETNITGNSIVMTNFFSAELQNNTIDKITGTGTDRYKKAVDYIDTHIDSFSYEDGINVLKNTVQSGSYSTQCSMLFDPEKSEIYIVLKRDFSRVFKVSLNNKTIETVEGFDQSWSSTIDEKGINIKDLLAIKNTTVQPVINENATQIAAQNDKKINNYVVGILLVSGVILVVVVVIQLKKRKRVD